MPHNPPLLVVADSNVPLDLAHGREDVLDAIALIRRRLRGGKILIPPRVVRELAFLADNAGEDSTRADAATFLRHHREWGCQLVGYVALGEEFVERVARQLRHNHLFPAAEVNDSVILVEAAVLNASLLLTTDEHLRGVDYLRLKLLLEKFELSPPVIATPREIVKNFLR
jgi:predicted nucleic acid-binding protein